MGIRQLLQRGDAEVDEEVGDQVMDRLAHRAEKSRLTASSWVWTSLGTSNRAPGVLGPICTSPIRIWIVHLVDADELVLDMRNKLAV